VNLPGSIPGQSANYFKAACASSTGHNWPLSFAIDSGYVSLVQILVAAGSRLPVEEIRDRQTRGTLLFDSNELLEPVVEASLQPASLQHICRASIRRAVLTNYRSFGPLSVHGLSPRNIDSLISSLPIPNRYRRYLMFEELEDIKIKRAQIPNGGEAAMMHLPSLTPCGLRAVVGMLMTQSPNNG